MLFMLILGQAVGDASCLPNLFPLKQIRIASKGFLHGRWKSKNKKDNFTLDFTFYVLLKRCFWRGRCHHAFSRKTLTDLNLFFSLGESDIFMKLQVQCRNADSFAVLIASSGGLTLYECLRFLNRFVQEKSKRSVPRKILGEYVATSLRATHFSKKLLSKYPCISTSRLGFEALQCNG